MITHPTLYKRTSTGAVQTWWIEQDGAQYWVATGQIDGAITRSEPKVTKGKNIGRSNETTPEAQAISEIASEYKKKREQGRYWDSIDDIDKSTYFAPMLAHPYEKYPVTDEQIESGKVLAQPKLDGVRCIADQNGLWTRKGKPITAMPHVWDTISWVFQDHPTLILDGELYNHSLRDHLNKISGFVRKLKLTPAEIEECMMIQYHVYDCDWGEGEDFNDRMLEVLTGESGEMFTDDGHVQPVPTHPVESRAHLDELNAQWLEEGFEGQIIRFSDSPYENKRSKYLLKRKEFIDEEYTIVGFTEGVGNRAGMAGNIVYRMDSGIEFSSGIAGGEDFYLHLWENQDKYIGGQGTVRYFKMTEYGKPYLPVTHEVFEGERDV